MPHPPGLLRIGPPPPRGDGHEEPAHKSREGSCVRAACYIIRCTCLRAFEDVGPLRIDEGSPHRGRRRAPSGGAGLTHDSSSRRPIQQTAPDDHTAPQHTLILTRRWSPGQVGEPAAQQRRATSPLPSTRRQTAVRRAAPSATSCPASNPKLRGGGISGRRISYPVKTTQGEGQGGTKEALPGGVTQPAYGDAVFPL